MIASSISNDKWTAVAATAVAGTITGCLVFLSAVDARSFMKHVEQNNTALIKSHFSIWWPAGRDFMVPMLLAGAATSWMALKSTGHANFGWSAALIFAIIPYTLLVMGEDIEALRKTNPAQACAQTRNFCNRHHLRALAAAASFGLTLVALAEL